MPCHEKWNEILMLYFMLCKVFYFKNNEDKYLLTKKYTLMQVENVGVSHALANEPAMMAFLTACKHVSTKVTWSPYGTIYIQDIRKYL